MQVLERSPHTLPFISSPCSCPPILIDGLTETSCFQVVFTYLAIRQRNTIQIWGLVIFNASFVAYSAVQVFPSSVFVGTELIPLRLEKSQTKSPRIHPTKTSSIKC